MSWKCWELQFKANSPLHIGYGAKLGIIDRTRYYIPGKTLWGAIVAKLGQIIDKTSEDPNEFYEDLGRFVKNNLIFSYFYIMEDPEKADPNILYPHFTKNGVYYGKLSKSEFEKTYITSYTSTALEKNNETAEEGSLHEIELIKDRKKISGELRDTYFIGYLFVNGKSDNNKYTIKIDNSNNVYLQRNGRKIALFDVIKKLQVGGERNYGYGRIELIGSPVPTQKLFTEQITVDLDTENKPILNLDTKSHTFSHLIVKDKNGNEYLSNLSNISGDFEPLVGREWDEQGSGMSPKFEGIGLVPGSSFTLKKPNNDENTPEISIKKYGFWEFKKEEKENQ